TGWLYGWGRAGGCTGSGGADHNREVSLRRTVVLVATGINRGGAAHCRCGSNLRFSLCVSTASRASGELDIPHGERSRIAQQRRTVARPLRRVARGARDSTCRSAAVWLVLNFRACHFFSSVTAPVH